MSHATLRRVTRAPASTLAFVSLAAIACSSPAPRPSEAHPSSGSESASQPAAAPTQPVQTCTLPRPSGFEVTIEADPALIRLDHLGSDCVAVPAHAEPLEWMASFRVADRYGAPEPLADPGAPVGRGTVELLGVQRGWVATRDELPFVGTADVYEAFVNLTHHDLDVVVGFAVGLPETARASVTATLSTLRVHAPTPTDALPYDPHQPICRGDEGDTSAPLTITIPFGARGEPSFIGGCAMFTGTDFETADWVLTVGPVPSTPEWAVLHDAEDGVQRALLGDPPAGRLTADGALTWLGTASHWYAADVQEDGAPPTTMAMTRVRVHGAVYYATVRIAPSQRAELPRLLAILETTRVVE